MFGAWVQAEKLLQIAFLLPSAGFIGWLAGYGLDHWLHQTWIATAGAIFGIVAGLVSAVRMAMVYGADSQDGGDGNGGEGGSGEAE
jgi:ATP synthase protein I